MEYTADDVVNMRKGYVEAKTAEDKTRGRMEAFLRHVKENGCIAWSKMFADINKIKDAFIEYRKEGGSVYSYSGVQLRMDGDFDVEISIEGEKDWFWIEERAPFVLGGVPLELSDRFRKRNEKFTLALMKLVVDWEYVFPEICETLYHHFESKEADLNSNSGEINFYLDNIEEREEEREER